MVRSITPLRSVRITLYLLSAFLFVTLHSCASYGLHRDELPEEAPQAEITYSVFSVGDLGRNPDMPAGILPMMQDELQAAGENSTLLILGDFTGPEGLPSRVADDARAVAEKQLNAKLDLLKSFPGQLYFIPGEQEYGKPQLTKNLKRVRKYVEKYLDKEEIFVPEDECSGPDDIDLTDDISLLAINSAWYLHDWNQDIEINGRCDYKDRESFMVALLDEISGLRDKTVIMAMHHPLQADGNRGGNYSFSQHLFPLRDLGKGLYLPLPIVGSAYRFLQTGIGTSQDLAHPLYKEMTTGIIAKLDDARNLIVMAAHENILQYSPERAYQFVISGTGSTTGPALVGGDSDFAYGQLGYSRTDFYDDGSVWLSFMAFNDEKNAMDLVYRKQIIEDRFAPIESTLEPVPTERVSDKEVEAPLYSEGKANRSALYRAILGDHYRPLYYTPITAPIAYLDTLAGGLKPYKRGGGMQTMSLRLKDQNDRTWDMRSIRKNPNQLLPYPLNLSFAADVLRDQFTAGHPFGAYAVPTMSKALGLYYMKPRYAFVPKQGMLDKFNDTYGDEIYMIQERPDDNWEPLDNYGNNKEIINTEDVLEEIVDDWEKEIDQKMYLRVRLLDAVIGDWDRHQGQWRWTTEDQGKGKVIYRPIAKDRDQVFSHFDGGLLAFGRVMAPPARKLMPFHDHLKNPKWFNFNARWNDRLFVNELTLEDWMEEAEYVQNNLTDEVFAEAVDQMPTSIAAITLQDYNILDRLKGRRADLKEYAKKYYEFLNETVNIIGTNKDDYFQTDRMEDGRLRVRVYDADSEGKKDEKYYDRIFDPSVTNEVILYGLDGDDHFEMRGEGRAKIKVRIVGGLDDDEYDADSGKGKTVIYDSPDGMEIKDKTGGERVKLTTIRDYNQYNFREYRQGYGAPYPLFGFDPTDGFQIGGGVIIRSYGFKKEPFAQQHNVSALYATRSMAFVGKYKGEFTNFFAHRGDLVMELLYRNPNYTFNFFGLGNETIGNEDDEFEDEYYFAQVEQARIAPKWRIRFRNTSALSFGPTYEFGEVNRNTSRFIGTPDAVPERVFSQQDFLGFEVNYKLNTLAVPAIPDRGLVFAAGAQYKNNLSTDDRSFMKYDASLSYYYLFLNKRFQIATRIGVEHIDGEFEFYQAPNLGGRTNLRGFATERFYGNTIAYHNTDIRLRGFGFGKETVPTTGGLIVGFDYGRVWLEGEESDVWHTSIGGGIWIAPLGAAVISATIFTSAEDQRVAVGVGFPF